MSELIIIAVIGFIVLIVLLITFFKLDDNYCGPFLFLGIVMAVILIVWIIAMGNLIIRWKHAEVVAQMLNERYRTEYTTEQILWGGDIVEKFIRTDNDLKDTNQKIELALKTLDEIEMDVLGKQDIDIRQEFVDALREITLIIEILQKGKD